MSFNWNFAIAKFSVQSRRNEFNFIGGNDIKWSSAFKYPHCQTFHLIDYIDTRNFTPLMIGFKLNKSYVKDLGLSFFIEERNMASLRNIDSKKETFTGQPLEFKNMSQNIQHDILLTISQTIYSGLDPEAVCVNYPNEKFRSFGDCDIHYMQKALKNDFESLMPFWATNNLSSVTSLRYKTQLTRIGRGK